VVAFCNIESEIYKKARDRVVDLTVNDSSEDEDDNQSDNDQDENGSPAGKDSTFDLDGDVDLESPFLQGLLSDTQTPTPGRSTTPAITNGSILMETRDRIPTEDDWKNM
jgi:hypothetical protein